MLYPLVIPSLSHVFPIFIAIITELHHGIRGRGPRECWKLPWCFLRATGWNASEFVAGSAKQCAFGIPPGMMSDFLGGCKVVREFWFKSHKCVALAAILIWPIKVDPNILNPTWCVQLYAYDIPNITNMDVETSYLWRFLACRAPAVFRPSMCCMDHCLHQLGRGLYLSIPVDRWCYTYRLGNRNPANDCRCIPFWAWSHIISLIHTYTNLTLKQWVFCQCNSCARPSLNSQVGCSNASRVVVVRDGAMMSTSTEFRMWLSIAFFGLPKINSEIKKMLRDVTASNLESGIHGVIGFLAQLHALTAFS